MFYTIFLSPVIVKSSFTFVGEVDRTQVMYVCSLYMGYFAEYTLLCHVKRSQCKRVITTIFEHHAVLSCLFGRIYQLPTLFYSHGCRNFNGYMLAMLHGVYCHGSVGQPVGTDEYEINVIPFAHSFPSIRSGIAVRLRITGFPKYLLGFNQIAFPDFTKCFDFDTFDLQITLQSQYTSIAKPYESKAYHREWGMCQSEHMCLRRSFHV